jgi:hypothetical protein
MPDLNPHPYEHHRPRRPRFLPKRLKPPPERQQPPDMRLALYVGIALAAVMAAVATPYIVSYLIQAFFG